MEVPWYGPQIEGLTPESGQRLINDFHSLSYYQMGWRKTQWLGVTTFKCPSDLWLYQEIIFDIRPDLIIETGTYMGGSAYFMASVLDMVGNGSIVTIDIEKPQNPPQHPRISYIHGSSVAPETVKEVCALAEVAERVLVILDSSHLTSHVLLEMQSYAPLVSPGSYMIVEDSNVNGNPILPNYQEPGSDEVGGPMEAIQEFLGQSTDFEIDTEKHRYLLTWNPNGFLRRK